jgi:hypothetical protein
MQLNVYECMNLLDCLQVAGALGSLVGNPADLALLRMQADGVLPLVQRRHYKYAHTQIIILQSVLKALLFCINKQVGGNRKLDM